MACGTRLQRSSPEAEGIPSSAVLGFIPAVEVHAHPLDAVQGFVLLTYALWDLGYGNSKCRNGIRQ